MFTADLLERAARSAVVAFVGALGLSLAASVIHGIEWSLAWWQSVALAAVAAGVMAAGSAFLALLTKNVGPDNTTASVLPNPSIDAASTVISQTIESHPLEAVTGQLVSAAPVIPEGYTLLPTHLLAPAQQPGTAVPVPAGESITDVDPATLMGGAYATAVPTPPPVTEAHHTDPVQSAHAEARAAEGGG